MICVATGKRVYRSKRDAKTVLRRLRGVNRTRLRPYGCDVCGGFHLGHRTRGYYQRQAAA